MVFKHNCTLLWKLQNYSYLQSQFLKLFQSGVLSDDSNMYHGMIAGGYKLKYNEKKRERGNEFIDGKGVGSQKYYD